MTRADASANLLWVLERILAVTHPICPFVTEAIWEHMPGERGLLMLAPLPAPDAAHRDADAERDRGRAIEIETAVRADPTTAIERELATLRAERDRAEGMLGNERFTSKAPPEVVAAEREKADRFAAEVQALESRLAALE